MRAGTLRERITIQRKSVARDALGAEVITWTEYAQVRAEAQPIAGREYVALQQAQSQVSIRFRTRYVDGVTAAMRVLWNAQPYEIIEAIDVGARNLQLELLCKGAEANG